MKEAGWSLDGPCARSTVTSHREGNVDDAPPISGSWLLVVVDKIKITWLWITLQFQYLISFFFSFFFPFFFFCVVAEGSWPWAIEYLSVSCSTRVAVRVQNAQSTDSTTSFPFESRRPLFINQA